jgi:hypothetical protein
MSFATLVDIGQLPLRGRFARYEILEARPIRAKGILLPRMPSQAISKAFWQGTGRGKTHVGQTADSSRIRTGVQIEPKLCRFRKEDLPLCMMHYKKNSYKLLDSEDKLCRHSEFGSKTLPRFGEY